MAGTSLDRSTPMEKGSSRWSVMLWFFLHHMLSQSQTGLQDLRDKRVWGKFCRTYITCYNNAVQSWRDDWHAVQETLVTVSRGAGHREEIHYFSLFPHTEAKMLVLLSLVFLRWGVFRPVLLVGFWELLGKSCLPPEGKYLNRHVCRKLKPPCSCTGATRRNSFGQLMKSFEKFWWKNQGRVAAVLFPTPPHPAAQEPLQRRMSSTQYANSKDFQPLLNPSKALTKEKS